MWDGCFLGWSSGKKTIEDNAYHKQNRLFFNMRAVCACVCACVKYKTAISAQMAAAPRERFPA